MSTIRRLLPLGLIGLAAIAGCKAQIDIDLTGGAIDDTDRVVLQIEGVELRRDDGQTVVINTDNGKDIDLLQLRNGQTLSLISAKEIGAARFTGVRLLYADSGAFVAPKDKDDVTLTTPTSPDYATVDFTLKDEENLRLVIDLAPRFSLVDRRTTFSDYQLNPYLRAAVPEESAGIIGKIDDSLVESEECRRSRDTIGEGVAVYVFAGTSTVPDDFVAGGSGTSGPIAAAELQGSSGSYRYAVSLLPPGSYTVALTCDADRDTPLLNDPQVLFRGSSRSITLQKEQTGTLDLES